MPDGPHDRRADAGAHRGGGGVSGFVDLNLVNGGLAAWRALLGLPGEEEWPDMGGPVHGTHVVGAALDQLAEREPIA
ncbi:MAG TPA: hypothetical protein PLR99_11110 [Polyangiaceae bacterium]|nr:hypothetical protein [Polyangiaceae bacterium]